LPATPLRVRRVCRTDPRARTRCRLRPLARSRPRWWQPAWSTVADRTGCDPLSGQPIRSIQQTACRYEKDRPGELVHMDVKKIGKIPDGGGWRAHGREIGRTSQQKKARIGYDYVHSVVDDH